MYSGEPVALAARFAHVSGIVSVARYATKPGFRRLAGTGAAGGYPQEAVAPSRGAMARAGIHIRKIRVLPRSPARLRPGRPAPRSRRFRGQRPADRGAPP